ncbi:MAG: PSD1 and planctomycete cytochrome C domain-containing protein [Bryobacteraceae bacterium]
MNPLHKCCLLVIALLASAAAHAGEFDFFETNVRPVLAARCYACHSEKTKPAAQAGLYLDSAEGVRKGGKSGLPAIVAGKPEESLLVKTIRGRHRDLKMPPGAPLPESEIAAIEQWIKDGAPDPRTGPANIAAEAPPYEWAKEKDHWAYRPLSSVAPPAIASKEWNATEVDRFVKAKLDEKKLIPLGRAPRRTWFRRLAYDLTGLAPSQAQLDEYLSDTAPGAQERAVDGLLASRAYAEQWGRHWLDLVRYADTAGDASDFPVPEMYRYRNYVIRSFAADKPFDRFLREQIAGDLLPAANDEDRRDKIVATSYVANSRRFGQTDREHYLTIDDTLDNMGKAFLGLSVGCARCHDHKFDPIPQRDYYGLHGIFESTAYAHAGLEHHQYLDRFVALDPKDSDKLSKAQKKMVELYRIVKKGEGSKPDDPADKRIRYLEASNELTRLRESFPEVPMAYAVSEGTPKQSHMLVKGDPTTPGPAVPRGFLQILGGQQVPSEYKGSGRDLLAKWITEDASHLAARVIVNRVWLWHFGRGIVNTPNDFGARGDRPTHPELLDWLAARFIEDGWSLRKLHKRILLTRAYATASGDSVANATADPRNETYWRFDRRRLSAEELRDTLLMAGGNLDPTPGGAHPFPPRGSYRFTQHRPFVADLDTYDTNRRSVYLIQQRFRRHPYLELFDGGDPNNTTPYRSGNTTALQSLYFFNNEFIHAQADRIAVRAGMAHAGAPDRVRYLYALLYGRAPSAAELAESTAYLTKAGHAVESAVPIENRNRAALASLTRVLLASNEFFYID